MVFVAVYEDDQDCTYCLRSLKEVFKFLANDISETWELQSCWNDARTRSDVSSKCGQSVHS